MYACGSVRKKTVVTALLIAMALIGCGKTAPDDQMAFIQTLNGHRSAYLSASNGGNGVAASAASRKATEVLSKIEGRMVKDWIAKVESVESYRVEVMYKGVNFELAPSASSKMELARLRKGSWIRFSGKMGRETSFTTSGAMELPEIAVANVTIAAG